MNVRLETVMQHSIILRAAARRAQIPKNALDSASWNSDSYLTPFFWAYGLSRKAAKFHDTEFTGEHVARSGLRAGRRSGL
jgi:hypothetical protein